MLGPDCDVMRSWLKESITSFIGRQGGFSLLELVIALGVLGLIGVGFMAANNTISKSTGIIDEKTVAVNLATDYIEDIKSYPYSATYPNAGDSIPTPFGYNVTIETEFSEDGTNFSSEYTDDTTLEFIRVIIARQGETVFSLCTYRSKR